MDILSEMEYKVCIVCPFPGFSDFRLDFISVVSIYKNDSFMGEGETVVVDLIVLHHWVLFIDFLSNTNDKIRLDHWTCR